GGLSTKLALGANHSCVVRDNGQGRCWGRNDYGQLGIENINNIGDGNEMPPAAVADIYPFTAIAAGERNTCGIDDVGGVRCWGYGAYGMIGAGNNNSIGGSANSMPPPLIDFGGGVATQISVGLHACALLQSGQVRCWGYN